MEVAGDSSLHILYKNCSVMTEGPVQMDSGF